MPEPVIPSVIIPPVEPITEPVIPEVPADALPEPERANPVKQLRDQLKKEQSEKADLAARLKALEEKDLPEIERLKRENAELAPVRDEHGRYKSALQEQFDLEFSAVPEDKRAQILDLVGSGLLDSQLRALQAAKGLLGTAQAPPVKAGTVTQPGGGQAPSAQEAINSAMKSGNGIEAIRLMRSAQFQDK